MVTMIGVWHITLIIHLLLLLFASSFSPPGCIFSNHGRRRMITSSLRQRLRQLKNVPPPPQFSRQMQRHLLPFWDFDPQNPSRLRTLCLSKNMNDHDHDGDGSAYEPLRVAGASVSPLGFLVLLKASFLADEETDIVFPVQITSSSSSSFKSFPTSSTPSISSSDSMGDDGSENENTTSDIGNQNDDSENTNNNSNKNDPKRKEFTIPALFRENIDQTSVTTPEALTFLQLLNGVDMATPVFPPDSLSKISVFYSFLWEDRDRQQREEEVEHSVSGEGEAEEEETADVLQVEDELGLSSSSDGVVENGNTHQIKMETSHSNKPAFDYIRSMIQTTLPPGISYLEASIWQRAKVQLPRVWLHGVRLEELDDSTAIGSDWEEDCENRYVGGNGSGENECSTGIATVPIRYILECSVDDKSKRLDIPLYTIPSSLQTILFPETSRSAQKQQVEISDELLRETSHSYHMETSAAFTSLALFQRYFKSSSSSGDGGSGPTLKVSTKLLQQLMKKESVRKNDLRYCWTKELESNSQKTAGDDDVNYDDDSGTCTIDDVIQSKDLPMYRPLAQLREEDQRVLSFLKKQNFGKGSSGKKSDKNDFEGNDSINAKKKNGKNGGSDGNATKCDRNQAIDDSSSGESVKDTNMQRKKTLTLEQQAKQQQLKAAWKIAMEKGDDGALEKIQIAMEEMEKEIMENCKNENDSMAVEYEGESSLEKIQRAMQESGDVEDKERDRKRNKVGRYDEDEDIVGLISELEEATNVRFEEEGEE